VDVSFNRSDKAKHGRDTNIANAENAHGQTAPQMAIQTANLEVPIKAHIPWPRVATDAKISLAPSSFKPSAVPLHSGGEIVAHSFAGGRDEVEPDVDKESHSLLRILLVASLVQLGRSMEPPPIEGNVFPRRRP